MNVEKLEEGSKGRPIKYQLPARLWAVGLPKKMVNTRLPPYIQDSTCILRGTQEENRYSYYKMYHRLSPFPFEIMRFPQIIQATAC